MFMELGLHIVLKPLLATEDDLLIGTYTPGKGSPTQWLFQVRQRICLLYTKTGSLRMPHFKKQAGWRTLLLYTRKTRLNHITTFARTVGEWESGTCLKRPINPTKEQPKSTFPLPYHCHLIVSPRAMLLGQP